MKIPLKVGKILPKQEALCPILQVRMKKKGTKPPIFGVLEVLIDTGSTGTFISYGDAQKSRIRMNKLPLVENKPIIILGCKFKRRILKNVIFTFNKEDRSPYIIELPEVTVAGKPIEYLVKGMYHEFIPSIIGTDFLKEYNLSLYFNPSKGKAYLEFED
ncbi:MAG: hypothetical protein KAT49_05385 [Methanomicrobia archaeon]|nr:hypothetical protein [Methanomicrobia archaeon]